MWQQHRKDAVRGHPLNLRFWPSEAGGLVAPSPGPSSSEMKVPQDPRQLGSTTQGEDRVGTAAAVVPR